MESIANAIYKRTLYLECRMDILAEKLYSKVFDKIASGSEFDQNEGIDMWNEMDKEYIKIEDEYFHLLNKYHEELKYFQEYNWF